MLCYLLNIIFLTQILKFEILVPRLCTSEPKSSQPQVPTYPLSVCFFPSKTVPVYITLSPLGWLLLKTKRMENKNASKHVEK